jgi:hypothetical protein
MRILLFLTLSFIISNRSNGQLNIDSLYGTMKNTIPRENIEISGFKKLTFYNELENTSYQFTVDKKGTIANNDWGSCLLITKMDSIGRPIEKRTFEKGGKLFGADSPPVIKIKYIDLERIEQTDFYNSNLSFVERIEMFYDSIGREIALIGYDKNLKITTKQTTEFIDTENARIKKFYNSNLQLIENDCGVSIWYIRTNQPNGFEVERRYLDKHSNLVDCTHEDPELLFAYNVAKQIENRNEWKMTYYTKKGEIVREFIFKTEE